MSLFCIGFYSKNLHLLLIRFDVILFFLIALSIICVIIFFVHAIQILICRHHCETYYHHKIAFFYASIAIVIWFSLFYICVIHKEEFNAFILNPIDYMKKIDFYKGASVFWSFIISAPVLVNVFKNLRELRTEMLNILVSQSK